MSASMSLVQFREVVEPIMNEYFDSLYEQRRDEWKTIFEEREGEKRSSHIETVAYGFGNAPIVGDGEPLPYDTGGTLWSINVPYDQIALGFGITEMAMEDGEHVNLSKIYSAHLAQSMYETEEILAANVLNNGFNAAFTQMGGDKQPLFSANHGMANGNVFSNITNPASLSATAVQQMLIQISQATDPMGKKIRLTGKRLIVPPALQFQAEVVLKSILNPDTPGTNAINPLNSMGSLSDGVQILTRFTSNTNWMIKTDMHAKADIGLVRYNRRNMKTGTQIDFNTSTVQHKASQRYRYTFIDGGRAIYGNLGQ
jgi:hypothetical protein